MRWGGGHVALGPGSSDRLPAAARHVAAAQAPPRAPLSAPLLRSRAGGAPSERCQRSSAQVCPLALLAASGMSQAGTQHPRRRPRRGAVPLEGSSGLGGTGPRGLTGAGLHTCCGKPPLPPTQLGAPHWEWCKPLPPGRRVYSFGTARGAPPPGARGHEAAARTSRGCAWRALPASPHQQLPRLLTAPGGSVDRCLTARSLGAATSHRWRRGHFGGSL